MFHSDKVFPIDLMIKVSSQQRKYTPDCDFCVVANGFPLLLLEVASGFGTLSDEADKRRLLLEAACIVRLGNVLPKKENQEFLIKAIFVDSEFVATEYTLYQRDTDGDDSDGDDFPRSVIAIYCRMTKRLTTGR